MRLFARRYPAEVVGMVLVDPAHEEQTIRIAGLRPAAEKAIGQFRALGRLSALGLMALRPGSIPSRGLPEQTVAGYRAVVAATGYFAAAAAETAGLEESMAQVRAARLDSLGDLPLVVVSRGLPETEGAADEREWRSMQAELAALSSKGMHVTAERSGHYVQLEQPEVVVDAILRVLREVRAARP
jgi:pimeloyl-ACP methyl ester carboxylesterase